MARARYDGVTDWYEAWAHGAGREFLERTRALAAALLPAGEGMLVDAGCGTGLGAPTWTALGWRAVGVDVSADQVRIAQARMPVLRARAEQLPFADASAGAACSLLTHTDIEDFAGCVRELARVVRPGGPVVYVGVHPCFVGNFVEPRDDGTLVGHRGYRRIGWSDPPAFVPEGVRTRVGAHHLTLERLLGAFLQAPLRLQEVREDSAGPFPELLGVRAV
ncbi:MAG TPA: class I SAM-dependent methyltransferase, partial [Candidatus Binatia bacterium]|nr:class I SAM-dependent methyltransferase [Candidatus Binatia bacterium]